MRDVHLHAEEAARRNPGDEHLFRRDTICAQTACRATGGQRAGRRRRRGFGPGGRHLRLLLRCLPGRDRTVRTGRTARRAGCERARHHDGVDVKNRSKHAHPVVLPTKRAAALARCPPLGSRRPQRRAPKASRRTAASAYSRVRSGPQRSRRSTRRQTAAAGEPPRRVLQNAVVPRCVRR